MTVSEAEIIYFISRCKCQGVKLFLCGLQADNTKNVMLHTLLTVKPFSILVTVCLLQMTCYVRNILLELHGLNN